MTAPTRASLAKRPQEVAAMFDRVAERYDVMNAVMTFGQERLWRRAATRALAVRSGERVLDLAAGTGTSAAVYERSGADVTACDFSLGMLGVGRLRYPQVRFVAGDALRLPFADSAYDAVTISFGLRNLSDVDAGLRELWRVTRPGGRLLVLETATPPRSLLRAANAGWLRHGMPRVARLLASNPEAYCYLAESMQAWPTQPQLAARIAAAGWRGVGWRDLTFGVVALHRARKPA